MGSISPLNVALNQMLASFFKVTLPIKTALGANQVTAIESVIDDNIAIINTPVKATGKPF